MVVDVVVVIVVVVVGGRVVVVVTVVVVTIGGHPVVRNATMGAEWISDSLSAASWAVTA